jgi:hypothetical protein
MKPFRIFLCGSAGVLVLLATGYVGLHLSEDRSTVVTMQKQIDELQEAVAELKKWNEACQVGIDTRDQALMTCQQPGAVSTTKVQQSDCEKALTAALEARDANAASCDAQILLDREKNSCDGYISDRNEYYENGRRCEEKLEAADDALKTSEESRNSWRNWYKDCSQELGACCYNDK